MTAPESLPMTDAQADYLLGAAMGLAQAARLIPVADLVEHFEQRYQEARKRAQGAERHRALEELGFASSLVGFVRDAESLMDARRNLALAEVEQAAATDLPPSRVPLAEDDVWATGPSPRR